MTPTGWLPPLRFGAGAWSGSFDAYLRTEDFGEFRRQLEALYNHLPGTAEFSTLEEWLALTLTGDKLGHVEVKGQAIDRAGIGNRLTFKFVLDQSYLPEALRQLEEIEREYPTR